MEHSVMQGVEAINNIVLGEPEATWIPPKLADVPVISLFLSVRVRDGQIIPSAAAHTGYIAAPR